MSETENDIVLREEAALRRITGTAFTALGARVAEMQKARVMPETDPARSYAGRDDTLMLSADQSGPTPPRPVSLKMIVERFQKR